MLEIPDPPVKVEAIIEDKKFGVAQIRAYVTMR